jgi:subtilase family serine protease
MEAIAPGGSIQYFALRDPVVRPADDYLLYETTADFGIEGQKLGLQEAFTFPSTVPAGQYYLGWIFDPRNEVCESDENNNTDYLSATSARLTVTSAGP